MTKLKVLYAFGSCGINDEGIIDLKNLEIFNAGGNESRVNHNLRLNTIIRS